jgi:hypothetical protein
MRSLTAIALCLVARSAAAQFTYVIPAAGSGVGFQVSFESDAVVTNLGSSIATVRMGALFLPASGIDCVSTPEIRTLATGLSAHVKPVCGPVFAYTIQSDQPLAATAVVRTYFTRECQNTNTEQKLDVASAFTAANVPSVVGEFKNGQTWRAKLIVINPNDRPITAQVTISRYDSALRSFVGTLARAFAVPPRGMLFQPLEEVSVTPPPNDPDFLLVPEHSLRITADGDYLAGVSYLSSALQIAEYRGAQPLAR